MTYLFEKVAEFNEKTGLSQEAPKYGSNEYWGYLEERVKVVLEEVEELKEAIANRDLLEVLDGAADIIYSTASFADLSGCDIESAVDDVALNNSLKYYSYKDNPIHREMFELTDISAGWYLGKYGQPPEVYCYNDNIFRDSVYYCLRNKEEDGSWGKVNKPMDFPKVDLNMYLPRKEEE